MVVHLYGLMCDMTEIMKIAKKNNLFVLEDCAQCFFAKDEKELQEQLEMLEVGVLRILSILRLEMVE